MPLIETLVLEPFVWIGVWIARLIVPSSPVLKPVSDAVVAVKEMQVFHFGVGLFSLESMHLAHLVTGYLVFGVLLYHYAVCHR